MTEARAGLLTARTLLDDALVGLRAIEDPEIPIRDAEPDVAAALEHVYRALASTGNYELFQREADAARDHARAALATLQFRDTRDPVAQAEVGLVAQAIGVLFQPSPPLDSGFELPRPGDELPVWPASELEPRAIAMARPVLRPSVLLPGGEDEAVPDAAALMPTILPDDAAPPGDLDELLARAADAAGAAGGAEEEEDDEDEDDETEGGAAGRPDADRAARARVAKEAVSDEAADEINFGVALGRDEVTFARARGFFEDLAMMGLMRQPDDGDLWKELAPVERRLLARIDAILACGVDVIPRLLKLLEDRPIPDPELTWGALMLVGSLVGDDARDQLIRLLKGCDLTDAPLFEAVADALFFVPHPRMEGVLREWLAADGPAPLRQLAVRVLGRRRVLSADEALAAAHSDEVPIVVDAASALGNVAAAVDSRELAELLRHKDEAVVAAAIGACFLRREAMGLRRAAELVGDKSGEYAQSAMYLALGGGASALDLFRRDAVRGGGGPVLVEALGWYGSLEAGPFLLERIAAKDDAAVLAMQRLTAASVTDDDPMPEYEPTELPFRRPHQAPPLELQLSADFKVWNDWWKRYVPGAELRARFRWGNPWSVRENLWEMDDALATPRQRRLAHLELVVRTGAELPFDPADFVHRQQRRIAEWRDYLELRRGRLTEGGYPTTLERR